MNLIITKEQQLNEIPDSALTKHQWDDVYEMFRALGEQECLILKKEVDGPLYIYKTSINKALSDGVTLFRPNSVRSAHKKGYEARMVEHNFCVYQEIGPRGGNLGYSISLPFGSSGGCQQGESKRSKEARLLHLQSVTNHYLSSGWVDSAKEASRLSEIHAVARSNAKPDNACKTAGDRCHYRLNIANNAVNNARQNNG